MDYIVHGAAMSWTRLSDFPFTSLACMTEQARYMHTALLPPSMPRGATADVTLEDVGTLVAEKKSCQGKEGEELQNIRQSPP